MKISAFVLLLSLLANLSFASFSDNSLAIQTASYNMDTVSRDGLRINLLGDWNYIGENKTGNGFASLSLFASGRFEGTTSSGQKVCGFWEVPSDGLYLVLNKTCEETGLTTETVSALIESVDGHMLTLDLPSDHGGKQLFIQ